MKKAPSPLVSLIPIIVLVLLLFATIRTFGSDALSGGSQVSLLTTTAICILIGMVFYKIPWKDYELAITNNIAGVATAIIILLIIGALSGIWMISGVVPTLIYYGMQIIHPSFFLASTCIICALISVMTGSSWTTIATIGIALMGIGKAQGFEDGWIAGAIISGAYFGDKISPLSETTILASSITDTPLFRHIRYMMITTVPSLVITLIIFTVDVYKRQVLPNAPAMIHLSKGRKTLLSKRNRLLKQLFEEEIIDASTYELAISEPLPDEPHPLPQTAPHLVTRFYQERNGLYTRSTIDKGIQTHIESLAERWSNEFNRSDIRNLAILIIDIPANQVVAYCGNVHFDRKQEGNQVDVIQAPRSTGSILKPFLYSAMLQEGSLLPQMLLPDVPVNINGFTPQNFSMQFEGAVPASEALARSLNIPAVTMLQRYGVPKFHHMLQQMGFKTINRSASHYGLSLILGGAEATLWDVTNAYAQMGRSLSNNHSNNLPQEKEVQILLGTEEKTVSERDGSRKVTSGKTISRKTTSEKAISERTIAEGAISEGVIPEGVISEEVISAGAAWLTLSALTEVNRPEEIDWKSIPSMQTIAWKTGTSYGFRDAWAVGVTPRLSLIHILCKRVYGRSHLAKFDHTYRTDPRPTHGGSEQ